MTERSLENVVGTRRGRPPVNADGKAMSNAERQARHRRRMIPYEPLLEVLVEFAELEIMLRTVMREKGWVKETWDAYIKIMRLQEGVARLVPRAQVTRTWGEKERRRREMAREAEERSGASFPTE